MTRVLDQSTDIGFAITADSGELELQADILLRSIRQIYPDAPVLVFVPNSSIEDIKDSVLERWEASATLKTGPFPIPEYPISAQIKALVEAEHQFNTQYLVTLDTDTILLDYLNIYGPGNVWIRPVDVGAQYWASKDSLDRWKALYQNFDYELPEPFIQHTASVDQQMIPPYWNSGVIITTDRTLPSRWLEYTKTVFNDSSLPISRKEFFIDQITLSLAVSENDVGHLTERENFPLGGRIIIPKGTAIVHYGDRHNLTRVLQPKIRSKFKDLQALPEMSFKNTIYNLLGILSTKSGRVVSYEQKQTIRRVLSWVLKRR